MTQINSYKEILELFRCKDVTGSEWTQTPFIIDNNIYSTDCHCMVWFDKNIISDLSKYNVFEKSKTGLIIPTEINIEKIIPVDEIKKGLSKCPTEEGFDWVGEDVPCKECEGDGIVIWEYNHHEKEFDCPECDGDGLTKKKRRIPNGKNIIPDYALIKLGQCFIAAPIIETIVKAADLLNEESIKLISQLGAEMANLFKIGDISLLVMPVIVPSNYYNVSYTIA